MIWIHSRLAKQLFGDAKPRPGYVIHDAVPDWRKQYDEEPDEVRQHRERIESRRRTGLTAR